MSKKKKKSAKKEKKRQEKVLKLQLRAAKASTKDFKVKSKCCKKYKKGESKRCGSCPCFDLIKKVA